MARTRDEPTDAADEQSEPDLWSLALFVYFVGLIVLVAVLLALPAFF